MLSLTCFPNQAEWPVHTAPAVTKENSVRDRTHRVLLSHSRMKKNLPRLLIVANKLDPPIFLPSRLVINEKLFLCLTKTFSSV
jgi:hypothetical protein